MPVRHVVVAAACLLVAACFKPVVEKQCDTDADCGNGWVCVDGQCAMPQPDAGQGGGDDAGIGGGDGGGASDGGGTGGGGGGSACPGCIDLAGNCQPGNGQFACGLGGGVCQTCPTFSPCVAGVCEQAPCNAQTCPDGCCLGGVCQTSSTASCGTGGTLCVQCAGSETCAQGHCLGCGPLTCPSGCCLNGACQAGSSRQACGIAGIVCAACPGSDICIGGQCLPYFTDAGIPTPDAGPVRVSAGSACTRDTDCQPPWTQRCQPGFTSSGTPTGYPDGYCTATCSTTVACADGVCVTETSGSVTASQCKQWCLGPGSGRSSCREGYVCVAGGPVPLTYGWCRPRCDQGPLAACPSGVQCDVNSGYCK